MNQSDIKKLKRLLDEYGTALIAEEGGAWVVGKYVNPLLEYIEKDLKDPEKQP